MDFDNLRARLDAVNTIVPLASGPKNFHAVEPVFSIILVTRNINVESVIEVSRGRGDTIERAEFSFGLVHAILREKLNLQMEIIRSCPERFVHDVPHWKRFLRMS